VVPGIGYLPADDTVLNRKRTSYARYERSKKRIRGERAVVMSRGRPIKRDHKKTTTAPKKNNRNANWPGPDLAGNVSHQG